MLDGLVAMGIVTHIHHLHLTDFVNRETIIAVIENRRYREHRVHHCHKSLLATHEVDKTLGVMEYTPGIMP